MVSVILQLLSGIGCAVVPWFYALLLMKLLSALATGGTMVTSYVICKWLSICRYKKLLYVHKIYYMYIEGKGLHQFFEHIVTEQNDHNVVTTFILCIKSSNIIFRTSI